MEERGCAQSKGEKEKGIANKEQRILKVEGKRGSMYNDQYLMDNEELMKDRRRKQSVDK
jgi:hypothetical protein